MMEEWLQYIIINIVFLLINPLTYWFLLLLFLSSYIKRRQERKYFATKVTPYFSEWKGTFSVSIIFSVILSVIAITFPLLLTREMLFGLILIIILLSISTSFSFLSAVYIMGITFFFFLSIPFLLPDLLYFKSFDWVTKHHLLSLVVFMIILLLAEAILAFMTRNNVSHPKLTMSKRGKWIGLHQVKKITFIPFLLFLPADFVNMVMDYIPFVSGGVSEPQLIIFPLFIGFQFNVKGILPAEFMQMYSKQLIILTVILIILVNISFYYPIFSIVTIVFGILGREYIVFRLRSLDKRHKPIFGPTRSGIKVLAMLPNSPAERIGLRIGETIEKVNGVEVFNSKDFYAALQNSGAFFKLYIRDVRGEMRFITSAFYEEDHYELGIIFPNEPYRIRNK